MDAYILNGAIYCEGHAPNGSDGPYPEGGGEADSPQHCDVCDVFLENPLTNFGARYVEEAVEFDLETGRRDSVAVTEWAPFYGIEMPA